MGKKREPSAPDSEPDFGAMIAESTARWESAFLAGDHNALIYQIEECAREGARLPQWAAQAFLAGIARIDLGDCNSLDLAFSWKAPPGQLPAKRNFNLYGRLVFAMCVDLRAARERGDRLPSGEEIKGIGLVDDFYAQVAQEFEKMSIVISPRQAREYFERVLREDHNQDWTAVLKRANDLHSRGFTMLHLETLSAKLS